MTQSGVGIMQGSNEDCLPMEELTRGGTHPQCYQLNEHTRGGRTHNVTQQTDTNVFTGGGAPTIDNVIQQMDTQRTNKTN